MSSLKNLPYYYDNQIKRYILQFMAVFAGLQVKIIDSNGEEKLIDVPIFYGGIDRVVAHILSDHTQNKPIRLPIMSAHLNNINIAPELRKGMNSEGFTVSTPVGGSVPEDTKTYYFMQAVPYKCEAEVSIFCSNQDQQLQILEQLLMVFNPTVVLQTTDSPFDPSRISSIELIDVRYEENYPSGSDRRILQTSLTFNFPIYLIPPINIKKDFIEKIKMRVGAVSTIANSNFDILSDLDSQNIEYKEIFSFDDIKDKIFGK